MEADSHGSAGTCLPRHLPAWSVLITPNGDSACRDAGRSPGETGMRLGIKSKVEWSTAG